MGIRIFSVNNPNPQYQLKLVTSRSKSLVAPAFRLLNDLARIRSSTMSLATPMLNHRCSLFAFSPLTTHLEISPKSSPNSNPPAKEDNSIGYLAFGLTASRFSGAAPPPSLGKTGSFGRWRKIWPGITLCSSRTLLNFYLLISWILRWFIYLDIDEFSWWQELYSDSILASSDQKIFMFLLLGMFSWRICI